MDIIQTLFRHHLNIPKHIQTYPNMIQTSCRHCSDIIQISSTFYQILCSQSRMTARFISFAFFCESPALTPCSSGWPHTLRPQPNVRLATCDRCGGDRKNIAPSGSSHNSSHRLVHFLVFRIPRQGIHGDGHGHSSCHLL